MTVRQMVRAEQEELRAVLAGLPDEDWNRPTLCGGWEVRDVVAHLISMNRAGPLEFLQATVSIHWFNATAVSRRAAMTPAELLADFVRTMGLRGFGRVVPPSAMLVEVLVHGQDIRRPLGLHRPIAPERLLLLLHRCVSRASYVPGFGFTGGRIRARGLRLSAVDVGWSWGHGPELSGPAEALLMAILARPAALADLSGDGVQVLASRIGAG